MDKPLLLVDIDGVISLFGPTNGGAGQSQPQSVPIGTSSVEGSFHAIEGIPHFLSATAAAHLLSLARDFQLVWASGWEEKANEHLPHLLGMPEALPVIPFSRSSSVSARTTQAHWKLHSVSQYVGTRPLAWIDDAFNAACHRWAAARSAPTLLVSTAPERGLTGEEALTLRRWAAELRAHG
jgi:HAD domain in Swiss Army Knife RNA repair proteins